MQYDDYDDDECKEILALKESSPLLQMHSVNRFACYTVLL